MLNENVPPPFKSSTLHLHCRVLPTLNKCHSFWSRFLAAEIIYSLLLEFWLLKCSVVPQHIFPQCLWSRDITAGQIQHFNDQTSVTAALMCRREADSFCLRLLWSMGRKLANMRGRTELLFWAQSLCQPCNYNVLCVDYMDQMKEGKR